jgi:transketolase
MEGVSHEASAIAGHLSLERLIVLFDDNGITIDGTVSASTVDDVQKRYESYGWQVLSADGHCEDSVSEAIQKAKADPRPSLIACKTKIGYGTPREGLPSAHSGALTEQELAETRKTLNWSHALFEIPEYIAKTWQVIGSRNRETSEKWSKTQAETFGAQTFEFSADIKKIFRNIKKEYFISRPFAATRVSSRDILSKVMEASNLIVSGSCDLGASTGCLTKTSHPIEKKDFSGDYIHYGVREHAMGAIMNGIAAGKKIRCLGGTFLVFSDYMRPAIRMSALMNIPTIFVFSHDSIGVGEDGATHQPLEHLSTLRAIPNLNVFRPADAMETLECWENALKSESPSVMVLTRQDVLCVRFCGRSNLCENGGYLLYEDALEGKSATVTIIATGSEVSIGLEVKKILNNEGFSVNLVSMPCWRLFDMQSDEYRSHILGKGLRVGIEASNGFGWEKYLGGDGLFFGVSDFGKSCSGTEIYKHFGLTAKNISEQVLQRLKRRKA